MKHNWIEVPEEQLAYATWLDWGMRLGFVALLVSFVAYLFGLAEPHVSHTELAHLWSQPVGDYLKATGGHTGWSWLTLAGKGDYMNLIGVAILSGVTVVCYARILPTFIKAKDRVFVAIVVLEILLLVLAASGVLVGAGH